MVKWFAPILSFTTEEIFTLMNKENKSIHLEKFIKFPKSFENIKLSEKWIELKKIRDICNSSIEEKRVTKEIGSSLEASLLISINSEYLDYIENIDLAELCITSKVKIIKTKNKETKVETKKAEGEKCPVCWKISKNPCERHIT